MVAVADSTVTSPAGSSGSLELSLDTAALKRAAKSIDAWRRGRAAKDNPDSIHEYFLRLLSCPSRLLQGAAAPPSVSLDSVCNLR
jgi:hypothetical protein